MKILAHRFSAVSVAVLFVALAITPTPRLQAQSNTASPSTTSAQVVDQLLSMVEHDIVPLAEAMPADKYDFAPTAGSFKGVRTFAGQVKHVVQANYMIFGAAASIQPTSMPTMQDLKTKAQIVQALKDSFAFGHRAVATLTKENALDKIQPIDGVNTRAGAMLLAVVHTNDHFGQMVVYARMNGIVPPSSRPAKK
jgi:uncharacterized damage-inducible protein DinB